MSFLRIAGYKLTDISDEINEALERTLGLLSSPR